MKLLRSCHGAGNYDAGSHGSQPITPAFDLAVYRSTSLIRNAFEDDVREGELEDRLYWKSYDSSDRAGNLLASGTSLRQGQPDTAAASVVVWCRVGRITGKDGGMIRAFLAASTMAFGLVACGGNGIASRTESSMDVPAYVQDMIAADFPADGQIHMRKTGKFQVAPTTLFCEMDASVDHEIKELGVAGIGIDGVKLAEAIRALGQSDYIHGSSRQRILRSGRCSDDGANIIYLGHALLNRTGDPYKLVLAVWQSDPSLGGAVWVGAMERLEGGPRPEISNPLGTDPLPFEIRADVTSLSSNFIKDAM